MNRQTAPNTQHQALQVSQQVAGTPLNIGSVFEALSFKHDQFDGLMDPLIMLDHYVMTGSTFGAHGHAGLSALSILFEDSEGVFNNRDSLGNNLDLLPGDAYWLKAGCGAVHDEKPTEGSRTHGLQLFVNLPLRHKQDAPRSLHVSSQDMPVISGEGHRVRVVLGESNGILGAKSPALPFTVLDAYLGIKGTYTHEAASNQSLVVYAVSGELKIALGDQEIQLPARRAIAIEVGSIAQPLQVSSADKAHFVVLQGEPIKETFVQKGPFVMSSIDELSQVVADYENGLLGTIAE